MCTVLGVQEAGDRAEAGLCHGAGQGAARGGLQAALPHGTGPLWLFLHLARAQRLPG